MYDVQPGALFGRAWEKMAMDVEAEVGSINDRYFLDYPGASFLLRRVFGGAGSHGDEQYASMTKRGGRRSSSIFAGLNHPPRSVLTEASHGG